MDDIQKKIVNLLDYINASEYAKDLEVFKKLFFFFIIKLFF